MVNLYKSGRDRNGFVCFTICLKIRTSFAYFLRKNTQICPSVVYDVSFWILARILVWCHIRELKNWVLFHCTSLFQNSELRNSFIVDSSNGVVETLFQLLLYCCYFIINGSFTVYLRIPYRSINYFCQISL